MVCDWVSFFYFCFQIFSFVVARSAGFNKVGLKLLTVGLREIRSIAFVCEVSIIVVSWGVSKC